MQQTHFNLLSVNKLTKDLNCKVWFCVDNSYMQGHLMKKPLLLGRARNTLHDTQESLNKDTPQSAEFIFQTTTKTNSVDDLLNKAKMWHLRLGHIFLFHVYNICFLNLEA